MKTQKTRTVSKKKIFKYFLMKSTNDKDLFGHRSSYLKWKGIIWNEIESFGVKPMKRNEKSVPIRNVPLHKQENIYFVFSAWPGSQFSLMLLSCFPAIFHLALAAALHEMTWCVISTHCQTVRCSTYPCTCVWLTLWSTWLRTKVHSELEGTGSPPLPF